MCSSDLLYKTKEHVYQGTSSLHPEASAIVISHDTLNGILTVKDIHGDFISTSPLIGSISGAKYNYTSFSPAPGKMAQIDIRVDPYTANVSDTWTANTIITEAPF